MQDRILVVEDDALQRSVLKAVLETEGHEVETASCGLDAIWEARAGRYDLVLLDHRVPEVDGLAAAGLIRELTGEAACPLLVAFTAAPGRLLERVAETGAALDGIVAKSAGIPALLDEVRRRLRPGHDKQARREAQDALLLEEWARYDAGPERPAARDGNPARPRILVAEDDALQRSVLKAALEAAGYEVETAHDGLGAVRCICERGYDLAVVDYQMPELDGFAAASLTLSFLSEATRPRLVALTAAPDRLAGRQAATGCSFDEVLAKPVDLQKLLAAVGRHLLRSPNAAARRAAEAAAAGRTAPHRA